MSDRFQVVWRALTGRPEPALEELRETVHAHETRITDLGATMRDMVKDFEE